ncbi:MAG: class I SAM-dependent methyltransferase [Acidimicrobiales bacterium]
MLRFGQAAFQIASLTRLRKYLYHRYDYSFTPSQLCCLVGCLSRTAAVPGAVVEIGCAYGHTTVFLEKHLQAMGDRRDYVCIDTFSGFTAEDAAFEEATRRKEAAGYDQRYADATLRSFRRTLANNGVTRVKPVQADIKAYDMSAVPAISFCLIDVDLYLPVRAALAKVRPLMGPGGIVVVDDCRPHPLWDGALQAYEEFVSEHKIGREIVEGQLGLVSC